MKELLNKSVPVPKFSNPMSSNRFFSDFRNAAISIEISPIPVRNNQINFQCEEKRAILCLEIALSLDLTTKIFNPGE